MVKLIMSSAKIDTQRLIKEELPWDQDSGLDFLRIKFLGVEGVMVSTTIDEERFITEKNSNSASFNPAALNAVSNLGINKVYVDSDLFLDELSICAGLNWTFGLRLVQKWMGKLTSIKTGPQSTKNSESPTKDSAFNSKAQSVLMSKGRSSLQDLADVNPVTKLSQISKLQGIERASQNLQTNQTNQRANRESQVFERNLDGLSDAEEVRSWDKVRFKFHTKTKLKLQNFGIKLLTGISPYDRDNI